MAGFSKTGVSFQLFTKIRVSDVQHLQVALPDT
jgi:hypothetical protein